MSLAVFLKQPMGSYEQSCTERIREDIIQVKQTSGNKPLMKLVREAIDNRNAKCEEDCVILQPLSRILILECAPGEEREDQKDERVSELIRAQKEFKCGNLLEG